MPYKSKAQAAYFNIHKKELEKQGVNVNEWNSDTKGKKLPKKKGRKKSEGKRKVSNSQSKRRKGKAS